MATGNKDYYKVLGVDKSATEKEIKQAYRKLARKCHPDVNKGDAAAESRFREINEAYSVLSDKEKRSKYDQFGAYFDQPPPPGAGGFGRGGSVHFNVEDLGSLFGGGAGDIFSQMFTAGGGGGGDFQGSTASRGAAADRDVEATLELTLEEAFNGTERTVQMQREDVCPRCHGTGRQGRSLCLDCRGSGVVVSPRRLDVKVPRGVREDTRIRVKGEGGIGPAGRHRDLHLVVKLLPHRIYEVKGDDLYREVPISVAEAALGAQIQFPTLRGTATMGVPPQTSSGTNFRLSGQGFPEAGGNKAGDLYVKIRIVVPRDLTAEEKSLYQKLAALRTDNPRADLR